MNRFPADEQGPPVRPSVLIVEDDSSLRAMLATALPDLDVRTAGSLAEARAALEPIPDAVLTDVHLGSENGITLARELRESHPRLPVLVMTAFGDLSLAVEALRAGAYDFLTKPLDLDVLRTALIRASETHRLRREVRDLRRQVRMSRGMGDLVGESAPMQRLFTMLERIAQAPSSVLIRGESGTGKELVARALHDRSARRDKPFVAVNMAALPENLLESELFGHVKGAFTDAHSQRTGLFVQAQGGTLFLDEIGDMPKGVQAKLLRVLQDRRVRPVGSDTDVGIDVRVVAATHKDIDALVESGDFRDDLRYRLDVIPLVLPPLRERGRDVLLLAQRFVQHFAERFGSPARGIATDAARRLIDYSWPGNVRELQNCMERAVVLCTESDIQLSDLPPKVAEARPNSTVLAVADHPSVMLPLEEIERRYILQVLEAVGGKRSEAARVLDVDRKTLYRKLERWKAESIP
ncbi:MAG: sigma-54 dependent transcriptional regulator [Myxococcota bacterium]